MQQGYERDGRGDEESSLESAIHFIRRSAETTGEESYEARCRIAVIQLESLRSWASDHSLILPSSLWEKRVIAGGAEHDIWFRSPRCWKVTRANHFGWTVLPGDCGRPVASEATPLEYLIRWKEANSHFGDRVELEGISINDGEVRTIVSQPIVQGTFPARAEISAYLRSRGFRELGGFNLGAEDFTSFYDIENRLGIFDAAPDNFILREGIPLPIDVVFLHVSSSLHEQLSRLVV